MTDLAVSISGCDPGEAKAQIELALASSPDILELRTDYLQNLTSDMLDELLTFTADKKQRVIVTCRDSKQGGQNDYSLDLRIRMLVRAVSRGADFIDCEYANYQNEDVRKIIHQALNSSNTRLILSAHDFNGRFGDIEALYDEMANACADAVCKLAYTAEHINDCFEAIELLKNRCGDAIVLCMGEAGIITRILAKKLGGFLTFACLDENSATAEGQISAEKLKKLYRWDKVGGDTRLFGVIGNPVAHSLSPAIFNACFDKQGIDALYVPVLLAGEGEESEELRLPVRRHEAPHQRAARRLVWPGEDADADAGHP